MPENKPYTPSVEEIGARYVQHSLSLMDFPRGDREEWEEKLRAEFRRGIAAHDAQVARDTLDGLAAWHRAREADHPYTEAWYAHRRAARDAENFQDANFSEEPLDA